MCAVVRSEIQSVCSVRGGQAPVEQGEAWPLWADIGETESCQGLKEYHCMAIDSARSMFLLNYAIEDIHYFLGTIRDRITERVLGLVERGMEKGGYGRPPVPYVWVGLGNRGRKEEMLTAEQGSMIVYDERLFDPDRTKGRRQGIGHDPPRSSPHYRKIDDYYGEFSKRAVEQLYNVGFIACSENAVCSNKKWRGSSGDWEERVRQRIIDGEGAFQLKDIMILADARPISGSRKLCDGILSRVTGLLKGNRMFVAECLRSAMLMPTALGLLGRFRLESQGENAGKINIRLHGLAALIASIRAFAVSKGIGETNSLMRIACLSEMGLMEKGMEESLTGAYKAFMGACFANQISLKEASDAACLHPDTLGPETRRRIREAMKAVEVFQNHIGERWLLGDKG